MGIGLGLGVGLGLEHLRWHQLFGASSSSWALRASSGLLGNSLALASPGEGSGEAR